MVKRQNLGQTYSESLTNLEGITTPMIGEHNTSVYAQYTILSEQREEIQQSLKEKDIPSVSYYSVPLHLQPVFKNLGHKEGDFPVAEKEEDQTKVIDAVILELTVFGEQYKCSVNQLLISKILIFKA